MRRRRHRSERETAEIDMTSMMDVVFIMLIFFIVTTSFVKEAGIEINRPTAASAERQERGNIMIAVSDTGAIWIDQRQVDLRAVRANVERLRAENPEGAVVIQADEASRTGVLVQVMDQVRLAGVMNVSIAATRP
ncbi:outer membrane transport energization protein ExbD (TC 2.C.1.1.1) [Geoalkalibacter ferrihydriticus]|uniref:Biopolymer transporter ExbD n=2 Tax=Geoalkalibacter ferrihydriticus TaxID=392333 RepID=A0A0C2HG57_9BACT|nr:biopolymer transporter ExbD [Geoalkalibacter ferrihydriticus]KIH75926.1 biopolymer transporter ExbD [Geoalkalibacter ferrihydriticus DSM 17813]SDM55653.1 outer membrane transport energization protein ExbD (TC 2.C.1.1.1) [Geoalkalibacter ferrihydriticus]